MQIFQSNEYTINYLNMRTTQLTILFGLVDLLPNIPIAIEQGNVLADLLAITVSEYEEHNADIELLEGVADYIVTIDNLNCQLPVNSWSLEQ